LHGAICRRRLIAISWWISVKTELIDRIYESSFVPELWPGVLDDLAQLTGSRGGLLFSARDRVLKWTASANLNDIFRSYVEDGWFKRCPRRICLYSRSMPEFFVEHDFWTEAQLDNARTDSAGRPAPACNCRPAIISSSASSATTAAGRSKKSASNY
jgi:hypothetical protein